MDNPYQSPTADCSVRTAEFPPPPAPTALRVATSRGLLLLAGLALCPLLYFAFIVFPGGWGTTHSLRQIIIVWVATLSCGIAALAIAVLAFAVLKRSIRLALISIALFVLAILDYVTMFWIH